MALSKGWATGPPGPRRERSPKGESLSKGQRAQRERPGLSPLPWRRTAFPVLPAWSAVEGGNPGFLHLGPRRCLFWMQGPPLPQPQQLHRGLWLIKEGPKFRGVRIGRESSCPSPPTAAPSETPATTQAQPRRPSTRTHTRTLPASPPPPPPPAHLPCIIPSLHTHTHTPVHQNNPFPPWHRHACYGSLKHLLSHVCARHWGPAVNETALALVLEELRELKGWVHPPKYLAKKPLSCRVFPWLQLWLPSFFRSRGTQPPAMPPWA